MGLESLLSYMELFFSLRCFLKKSVASAMARLTSASDAAGGEVAPHEEAVAHLGELDDAEEVGAEHLVGQAAGLDGRPVVAGRHEELRRGRLLDGLERGRLVLVQPAEHGRVARVHGHAHRGEAGAAVPQHGVRAPTGACGRTLGELVHASFVISPMVPKTLAPWRSA